MELASAASQTTVGKTKLTVTPEKAGGNSYKYKVSSSATGVVLNQNVQTWKSWNGSDEIEATSGQFVTIVECDASYKAIKAGSATVTAKTE